MANDLCAVACIERERFENNKKIWNFSIPTSCRYRILFVGVLYSSAFDFSKVRAACNTYFCFQTFHIKKVPLKSSFNFPYNKYSTDYMIYASYIRARIILNYLSANFILNYLPPIGISRLINRSPANVNLLIFRTFRVLAWNFPLLLAWNDVPLNVLLFLFQVIRAPTLLKIVFANSFVNFYLLSYSTREYSNLIIVSNKSIFHLP